MIFVLIFYWGIWYSFEEFGLYNIFFSEDYKCEFVLLEVGEVYEDLMVYVNIFSKCELGDVFEGYENWFIMINVFYDSG